MKKRNPSKLSITTYAAMAALSSVALASPVDHIGDDGVLLWIGGNNDFSDSANWDPASAPDLTTHLVFFSESDSFIANLGSGPYSARSIGVGGGATATLNLNGSTLTLPSTTSVATDSDLYTGYLYTQAGSTLHLAGTSTSSISASTIEAFGNITINTNVQLDGGSINHPVRKGRYAIVVGDGGSLTLESGANVNVQNGAGTKPTVRIGEANGGTGAGTLTVEIGATLTVGDATSYALFQLGDWGGTGVVDQTGGEVTVNGIFNIGNEGGNGTYNLSGGTLDIGKVATTTSNALILGRTTNADRKSQAALNISGDGVLHVHGHPEKESSFYIGGPQDEGSGEGTGVVTQTGGTVIIDNGVKFGFGDGDGTYNLNGGVLQVGGASGIRKTGTGSYAFNFGGGTLEVTGNALTTAIHANVVTGTRSVIDAKDADITWSGNLTGDGTLEKIGEHDLILTGENNSLGGEVYVTEGAIRQTAGTSNIHYYAVGSGGGADGAAGISDGVLNIGNAFQVGDWDGEGVFDHTGGTVNVTGSFNVGNQGGNGVYNLGAGTLNLNGGLYSVGRSASGNPAGHGIINITHDDSELIVHSGNFIIGDRDPTTRGDGANASGEINQTAGVFRVEGVDDGNSLHLAGHGNGVYNLFGGRLEIGGNHLRERYQGSGSYEFNLGNASIKVINSKLTTVVDATLMEETTFTFDTDTFGATWGGELTGQGAFRKIGDSDLELAGGGTIGEDTALHLIEEGSVTISESMAVRGVISVIDGASLNINSELQLYSGAEAGHPTLTRLGIGLGSTGSLNINAGGKLFLDIEDTVGRFTIGRTDGGNAGHGTVTMTGGEMRIRSTGTPEDPMGTSLYGSLDVGRGAGATGVFYQSGGVVEVLTGAFQVGVEGATGEYRMSGNARTSLTVDDTVSANTTFYLGNDTNGDGLLEVADNARFEQGTESVHGGQAFIGSFGGKGTINQSGNSYVSFLTKNEIHFGYNGGEADYNLAGGELFIGGARGTRLGQTTTALDGTKGTVTQTGGTMTAVGDFVVGDKGEGAYSINGVGARAVFGGPIKLAQGGGKGSFTLAQGTVEIGGTNAISTGNAENTTVRLGDGTLKVVDSALTTSVDAELVEETTFTLDTNGLGATWSGALTGDGGLAKKGEGVLILDGANTYTGATTVLEGTLQVDSNIGTGGITVNEGAALTGSGVIGGMANIQGALNPGNSPGELSFEGLTLESTSITTLEINGTDAGEFDTLNVSDLFVIEGGELKLQLDSLEMGSYSLDLFTGTSPLLGDFDMVNILAGGNSFALALDGGLWSYFEEIEGGSYAFSFEGSTGVFTYEVIPEPSTYALLIGAGATLWMASRRRRASAGV